MVTSDFLPLRYNQKAELLNPHFMAMADASFDWRNTPAAMKRLRRQLWTALRKRASVHSLCPPLNLFFAIRMSICSFVYLPRCLLPPCLHPAATRQAAPPKVPRHQPRADREQTETDRLNVWLDEQYEQQLDFSPQTRSVLGDKTDYDQLNDVTLKPSSGDSTGSGRVWRPCAANSSTRRSTRMGNCL